MLFTWQLACSVSLPSLMNGRTAPLFFVQAVLHFSPVRSGFGSFTWGNSLSPARCQEGSLLCWPQSPGPDLPAADSAEPWTCCLCGSDPEVKGLPGRAEGTRIPLPGQSFARLHSLSCVLVPLSSRLCRPPHFTALTSKLCVIWGYSSDGRAWRFGSFYRCRLFIAPRG